MHVCMHVEARGGCQVSSCIALCLISLRGGLSLKLKLAALARLAASEFPGSACLHAPHSGLEACAALPCFLIWMVVI